MMYSMNSLTLSGKDIISLETFYDGIISSLHLDANIFGRNFDALYDVLRDSSIEKIIIQENHLLKEHLSTVHKNWNTYYTLLIDTLTDLEGVDIHISY